MIAHELAHVRRRDLWVNLFQRLTETLLFYHPAVWWLSRRIRVERELCCDDLATQFCGSPVALAEGLAAIEAARDTELARFIHGLGIPEVGVTVARVLADHFRANEFRVTNNASDVDQLIPMAEQAMLDMLDLERLLEQRIVQQGFASEFHKPSTDHRFIGLLPCQRTKAPEVVGPMRIVSAEGVGQIPDGEFQLPGLCL